MWKKDYKGLVEASKHREAGALMTICTRACWTPARLAEEGIIQAEEAKCPLCGERDADEGHLFWECRKVMEAPTLLYKNQIGFVQNTAGKSATLKAAHLYWRGLVSEIQTQVHGHISDTVDFLGDPIAGYEENSVKICTDGSGGTRTNDRRRRRCGWAWVVPVEGSDKVAKYGARGALGGVPIVPRAELRAIHHCLASLKGHYRRCDYICRLQNSGRWFQ